MALMEIYMATNFHEFFKIIRLNDHYYSKNHYHFPQGNNRAFGEILMKHIPVNANITRNKSKLERERAKRSI